MVDNTLYTLGIAINGYQMMADEIERLHNDSVDMLLANGLEAHSKKALDGLNGIITSFKEWHDALVGEEKEIPVPVNVILNKGKPNLKIVGGTEYNTKQFNFTKSPLM